MPLDFHVKNKQGTTMTSTSLEYGTHFLLMGLLSNPVNPYDLSTLISLRHFYGGEAEWRFTPEELPELVRELAELKSLISNYPQLVKEGLIQTVRHMKEMYENAIIPGSKNEGNDELSELSRSMRQEEEAIHTAEDVRECKFTRSL